MNSVAKDEIAGALKNRFKPKVTVLFARFVFYWKRTTAKTERGI